MINTFISDTSQPKDRSMRYGMLKLLETLGKPLGALLGNFILNEGGYVWAYATVLIGLLVASTYVCVIMRYHTWRTPNNTVSNYFNDTSLKNFYWDLFSEENWSIQSKSGQGFLHDHFS